MCNCPGCGKPSGLPLKVETRVRIPLGLLVWTVFEPRRDSAVMEQSRSPGRKCSPSASWLVTYVR
jgi:hypothetical protein